MKELDTEILLQRINAALKRGEIAADRLHHRHVRLRSAAQETLAGLDKLIENERKRSDG